MGEVYRARDTRLDRDVAIKVFAQTLVGRTGRRGSASNAKPRRPSGLNHPHICTLLDVGRDDGTSTILVMELIEGETLA